MKDIQALYGKVIKPYENILISRLSMKDGPKLCPSGQGNCSWNHEKWIRGECVCVCARACACSLQLCSTLCDPMNCSPPGSSVHGIIQSRTLEWVVISLSRGSSQPRDWTHISCISCTAGKFFTIEPLGKPEGTIYFQVNVIWLHFLWKLRIFK